MRLTVLGKSPAWQDAGGACSGYLVEEKDFRLLLDCGNGVFGKLRLFADYRTVDAVVISHMHADHFLDLVPFAYALTLGPATGVRPRPRLHLPPGGAATMRGVVAGWGNQRLIESAFEVTEYETAAELEAGPLTLRMHLVPHFTETHAVELMDADGGRIVFGSDGRASEQLREAARGADLLLAEATLAEPEQVPPEQRGHMAPFEAGELAAAAGVGRLVLTHISDELDQQAAATVAEQAFGALVDVAAEGAVYAV